MDVVRRLFVVVAARLLCPNPIIILILILGAMETCAAAGRPATRGDDDEGLHQARHRLMVAAVYIGLIVALAVGMDMTHLARTLSDA